jgi:hypothetical protein
MEKKQILEISAKKNKSKVLFFPWKMSILIFKIFQEK